MWIGKGSKRVDECPDCEMWDTVIYPRWAKKAENMRRLMEEVDPEYWSELKAELQAVRIHSIATQQDIQNIYATLARQEGRVERIERRLELSEGEFAR